MNLFIYLFTYFFMYIFTHLIYSLTCLFIYLFVCVYAAAPVLPAYYVTVDNVRKNGLFLRASTRNISKINAFKHYYICKHGLGYFCA